MLGLLPILNVFIKICFQKLLSVVMLWSFSHCLTGLEYKESEDIIKVYSLVSNCLEVLILISFSLRARSLF